eukprot:sb/3477327/
MGWSDAWFCKVCEAFRALFSVISNQLTDPNCGTLVINPPPPQWPSLKRRASGSAASLASLFADMNAERLNKTYDAPVITFSHFMPRPELMKATSHDEMEITLERNLMVC